MIGLTKTELHAFGNVAAMREALQEFVDCWDNCNYAEMGKQLVKQAIAALATPPRNCDVGTAEEQAQRFHYFCASNQSVIDGMCQPTCPCIDCPDKCHCLMLWAQMPYEKGVAK